MTAVSRHRLGEPCWVDYASTDVPAARDFYTGLFGWQADAGGGEYGGYITFLRDGRPVAGLGSVMGDQQGDTWLTYLMAEDVDATERAAKAAGADVLA
ncbi:MAG TPA: VOC family protein, partial [Leifsonia sp.]